MEIELQNLSDPPLFERIHKRELLLNEVEYLGLDVTLDGIRSITENVEASTKCARPETVKIYMVIFVTGELSMQNH